MPEAIVQNDKKIKEKKKKFSSLLDLSAEVNEAAGTLLETTGAMHSFTQALHSSGFREYIDYMGRPWHSFLFNFLIGIARGLGFVIGATVVVALVVWIVSQFLTQLPYVGDFFLFLEELLSPENLEKIRSGEYLKSFGDTLESLKTNPIQ